jgi:hypothetical protein
MWGGIRLLGGNLRKGERKGWVFNFFFFLKGFLRVRG